MVTASFSWSCPFFSSPDIQGSSGEIFLQDKDGHLNECTDQLNNLSCNEKLEIIFIFLNNVSP